MPQAAQAWPHQSTMRDNAFENMKMLSLRATPPRSNSAKCNTKNVKYGKQTLARTNYQQTMKKVHRVAHLLLARGSALRAQAEEFASGVLELMAYPALYNNLKAYALIPVVCRRIEGAHAEWKAHAQPSSRFAWVASKVRRRDILRALEAGPLFLQLLEHNWRRRDAWRTQLFRCCSCLFLFVAVDGVAETTG